MNDLISFLLTLTLFLSIFTYINIYTKGRTEKINHNFLQFNIAIILFNLFTYFSTLNSFFYLSIIIIKLQFITLSIGILLLYKLLMKMMGLYDKKKFKISLIIYLAYSLYIIFSTKIIENVNIYKWGFTVQLDNISALIVALPIFIPLISILYIMIKNYNKFKNKELPIKLTIFNVMFCSILGVLGFIMILTNSNYNFAYPFPSTIFLIITYYTIFNRDFLLTNLDSTINVLENIFKYFDDGIILIDSNNKIIFSNEFIKSLNIPKHLFESTIFKEIDLKNNISVLGKKIYINNKTLRITKKILSNKNSKKFGKIILIKDVTQDILAQEKIREVGKKYRKITEAISDFSFTVFIKDNKPMKTIHSNTSEFITGYTKKEFENNPNLWLRIIHPMDKEFISFQLNELIKKETIKTPPFEHRIIRKDGKVRWVRDTIIPSYNKKGNLKYYEEVVTDITEKKLAEEALKISEERFRTLSEQSLLSIMVIEDYKITFTNDACAKLLDESNRNTKKLRLNQLFKKINRKNRKELFSRLFKNKKNDEFKIELANTHKWVELFIKEIDVFEKKQIIVIGIDITNTQIAQQKVLNSLEEKNILLKEIHHRVKNNLQIISSLLSLQLRYIDSEKDIEVFKDSQNRIKSMSLIHEKLYQSNDFTNIDISDYIKSLSSTLHNSYFNSKNSIEFRYFIDKINLNINQAIPCGLIINELISNSLKYAFTRGDKGIIEIILSQENNKSITLIIRDNGKGLPAKFDISKQKSLGLQLVQSLTKQLDGKLKFSGQKGTNFEIIFKKE